MGTSIQKIKLFSKYTYLYAHIYTIRKYIRSNKTTAQHKKGLSNHDGTVAKKEEKNWKKNIKNINKIIGLRFHIFKYSNIVIAESPWGSFWKSVHYTISGKQWKKRNKVNNRQDHGVYDRMLTYIWVCISVCVCIKGFQTRITLKYTHT